MKNNLIAVPDIADRNTALGCFDAAGHFGKLGNCLGLNAKIFEPSRTVYLPYTQQILKEIGNNRTEHWVIVGV